ncbi:MAG: hypothetical protein IKJ67_04510 [Bacteroidales bacterium]|nr:hypothetical protein [Bacteroidales bacterium]
MIENIDKYNALRKQYPTFCYQSFEYDITPEGMKITFLFTIGETITFMPTITIPQREFYKWNGITKEQYDLLVFNIGMIELISYWKATCSPTIVVKPYSLNEEQIKFWQKLYYNGLSEFFYINGINSTIDDFVNIKTESTCELSKTHFATTNSYIVPIGGGKDSVVTLEILSQAGKDICPMIINPRGATLDCAHIAGYERPDFIEIQRTIHPKLLELNAQGFLNGHTPFSAMLAFHSLLVAAITGRKHIALSNESSANESTIVGTNVNHQYSKSLEFENDFRSYVSSYITDDINYFSFLRPLSELQIAMFFAKNEKYFDVFKSCNVGSKTDIWCGNCPKCLFAYIILSPFIKPEVLNGIFGKAMLDDASLQLYFDQLTGLQNTKPFECVGTIDEVNTALAMTIERYYSNCQLPYLLKNYSKKELITPLNTLSDEHNLDDELIKLFDL